MTDDVEPDAADGGPDPDASARAGNDPADRPDAAAHDATGGDETGGADIDTPAGGAPATGRPRRPSRWDRPKEPHDWRWVVGGIGRALIVVGLLMFAFVGYQLWGTGIQTAQAQNRLADEFDDLLAAGPPSTTTAAPTTTVPSPAPTTTIVVETTLPPALIRPPDEGEPLARLDIASIGIENKIVVEGVSPSALADGPGHFPETPLPGQYGNAAIAGHRTTHGQPFYRIDELEVGDEIVVTTLAGRYVYLVTGQTIVGPNDYSLVIPTVDPTTATLTLTSCHPRYSAKQRIVVFAEIDLDRSDLVTAPSLPPGPEPGESAATLPSDDDSTASSTASSNATTTSTEAGTAVTSPAGQSSTTVDAGSVGDSGQDVFENRWFSDPGAIPHVIGWGLVLVLISIGSYLVSRRARNLWVGTLVAAVPFLVTLYFWFENVNRLLPPNL